MESEILTLRLMEDRFGVCRLDAHASVPGWAGNNRFCSVTRTAGELSIVCPEVNIPDGIKCENGWRILKIEGTLDFSLIGILSSISSILAREQISIFVVSTFDTDYILVRNEDIDNAVNALASERYKVIF